MTRERERENDHYMHVTYEYFPTFYVGYDKTAQLCFSDVVS